MQIQRIVKSRGRPAQRGSAHARPPTCALRHSDQAAFPDGRNRDRIRTRNGLARQPGYTTADRIPLTRKFARRMSASSIRGPPSSTSAVFSAWTFFGDVLIPSTRASPCATVSPSSRLTYSPFGAEEPKRARHDAENAGGGTRHAHGAPGRNSMSWQATRSTAIGHSESRMDRFFRTPKPMTRARRHWSMSCPRDGRFPVQRYSATDSKDRLSLARSVARHSR